MAIFSFLFFNFPFFVFQLLVIFIFYFSINFKNGILLHFEHSKKSCLWAIMLVGFKSVYDLYTTKCQERGREVEPRWQRGEERETIKWLLWNFSRFFLGTSRYFCVCMHFACSSGLRFFRVMVFNE